MTQEIKGQFVSSKGKSLSLPSKGRYLLWLSDALYAKNDPLEIKQSFSNNTNINYYNIRNYTKLFSPKDSYIIFYSNIGSVPESDEWPAVQDKIGELPVLFDSDDALSESQNLGGYSQRPNLTGLYLMDGQKIVYRFLTNNTSAWNAQGLIPLIQDAANTFLKGGTPKRSVLALAQPGAILPKSLWNTGKPSLFFRISGEELNVPPAPLSYEVTTRADGSSVVKEVGSPPRQVSTRFVLDNLPALTRSSGVQLVALVMNTKRLAELKKVFPTWTFLPLESPQDRLAWYDVNALLVDGQGKVRLPFSIFPSNAANTAVLENALDALRP